MFNILCLIFAVERKNSWFSETRQPEQPLWICPSLPHSRTDHFQPQRRLTLFNQQCIFRWIPEDEIETLSFFFKSCKRPKAARIFNKTCKQKNSLRNTCSENYGQRWFQMFSALFSVNIFLQSFHEEHYYLFWFKILSTERVFLLFTAQSKQRVHLFCCNQSQINQQKLGSEQSSAA